MSCINECITTARKNIADPFISIIFIYIIFCFNYFISTNGSAYHILRKQLFRCNDDRASLGHFCKCTVKRPIVQAYFSALQFTYTQLGATTLFVFVVSSYFWQRSCLCVWSRRQEVLADGQQQTFQIHIKLPLNTDSSSLERAKIFILQAGRLH